MKRIVFGLMVVLAIVMFAPIVMAADANKVTVWCWDPNFNVYATKQAAAVYNKTKPNVTIEIVDMAQDIEAKITAGLQEGGAGLPDVALFQDFRIEQFIQDYPNAFMGAASDWQYPTIVRPRSCTTALQTHFPLTALRTLNSKVVSTRSHRTAAMATTETTKRTMTVMNAIRMQLFIGCASQDALCTCDINRSARPPGPVSGYTPPACVYLQCTMG
jgi:hypothetical protein